MKKLFISVTAHVNCTDGENMENMMTIYEQDLVRPLGMEFGKWLDTMFPAIDWQIDDGEDTIGTDYVQYVSYTDKHDKDSYVLAVYENEDE